MGAGSVPLVSRVPQWKGVPVGLWRRSARSKPWTGEPTLNMRLKDPDSPGRRLASVVSDRGDGRHRHLGRRRGTCPGPSPDRCDRGVELSRQAVGQPCVTSGHALAAANPAVFAATGCRRRSGCGQTISPPSLTASAEKLTASSPAPGPATPVPCRRIQHPRRGRRRAHPARAAAGRVRLAWPAYCPRGGSGRLSFQAIGATSDQGCTGNGGNLTAGLDPQADRPVPGPAHQGE